MHQLQSFAYLFNAKHYLIAFLREKLQRFRADLKICGNLDETDTLWSYIPRTLITQQTIFFYYLSCI
jgi:hypothetical protein